MTNAGRDERNRTAYTVCPAFLTSGPRNWVKGRAAPCGCWAATGRAVPGEENCVTSQASRGARLMYGASSLDSQLKARGVERRIAEGLGLLSGGHKSAREGILTSLGGALRFAKADARLVPRFCLTPTDPPSSPSCIALRPFVSPPSTASIHPATPQLGRAIITL